MGSEDYPWLRQRTADEQGGLRLVGRPDPIAQQFAEMDRRLDALQSQLTSLTSLMAAFLELQKATHALLSLMREERAEPACR